MDTNKDEAKHSRHKNSSAWSNEVINRNSDEDDENPHTVQYKPEGMASQDLTAMNSDHFQVEQSVSKMHISVQDQGDMNAEQQEAELNGAMNVDRQGDARQPFPFKGVFCWKLSGFFNKDLQHVRQDVNDRGLFTADWFSVREKYCFCWKNTGAILLKYA